MKTTDTKKNKNEKNITQNLHIRHVHKVPALAEPDATTRETVLADFTPTLYNETLPDIAQKKRKQQKSNRIRRRKT